MEYPRVGALPDGMVRLPNGRVVSREEYERMSQRMPINTAGTPVSVEPPVGPAERIAPPTPAPVPSAAPMQTPMRTPMDNMDMNRLRGREMPKPPLAEQSGQQPSGLLDVLLSQKTEAKPKRTGKDWAEGIGAGLLAMSNNPGLQRLGMYGFERMGARRDEERAQAKTNTTVDSLIAAGIVKPEQAAALRSNPDLLKSVFESALKADVPLSKMGKLTADLKAGRITQAVYDKEMAAIGSPLVQIGEGGKWSDTSNKYWAERYGKLIDQGDTAGRLLSDVATLEQALQNSPTGTWGGIVSFAQNTFGVTLDENASDLQVAEAIINRLVPQQRPPGSGPMSDADLKLFKQSLPQIIGTPEGNSRIINAMRAMAEYDRQAAAIASRVFFDENYTPAMGQADIAKLQDQTASLASLVAASPGTSRRDQFKVLPLDDEK